MVDRMSSRDRGIAKRAVMKRDGQWCACCKLARVKETYRETDNLELDHVLALALGGTDDLNNLWLLCGECHDIKTAGDMQRIREDA